MRSRPCIKSPHCQSSPSPSLSATRVGPSTLIWLWAAEGLRVWINISCMLPHLGKWLYFHLQCAHGWQLHLSSWESFFGEFKGNLNISIVSVVTWYFSFGYLSVLRKTRRKFSIFRAFGAHVILLYSLRLALSAPKIASELFEKQIMILFMRSAFFSFFGKLSTPTWKVLFSLIKMYLSIKLKCKYRQSVFMVIVELFKEFFKSAFYYYFMQKHCFIVGLVLPWSIFKIT